MQMIRMLQPQVFGEDYAFDPYRAVRLREGGDVTLVSTGYMTPFAVEAADALAAEGVGVDLLHYPSVKPFDADTLAASARKTGGVVTVENQSIIGGLGGAVCEALSEQQPTRVKRLGIPDRFGEIATEAYLFKKHGFGVEHMKRACRDFASKTAAAKQEV